MKSVPIRFNINGEEVTAEFAAHVTLLQALRELGHMEVKNGCEKGDAAQSVSSIVKSFGPSAVTVNSSCESPAVAYLAGNSFRSLAGP